MISRKSANKWRNYRYAYITSGLILALCFIIILLDAREDMDLPPLLVAFANCGIGAVLGVIIIDLVYQWGAEKELEESLQDALVQILTGDNHRLLRKLYNNQSIRKILQNCIESFCGSAHLSENYLRYIENSCRLLKKDEQYKVHLTQEQGLLYLKQSLLDTRCFKDPRRPFANDRIQVKSYLVLKRNDSPDGGTGELDKILNDNSYYFREEIQSADLCTWIDTLDPGIPDRARPGFYLPDDEVARKIVEKLCYGVKIRLNDPDENGHVRFTNRNEMNYNVAFFMGDAESAVPLVKGIEITNEVPAYCIQKCKEEFDVDDYIQYTAELTIKYPTEQENTFYSMYAAPTLGAEFKLIFDASVPVDMKDVNYMTFISFADAEKNGTETMDGKIDIVGRNLDFKTSRTIFPRSGISVSWSRKC